MSYEFPIVTASGAPSSQSIYESRAGEEHPTGTRASTEDGRVFYYVQASSIGVTQGELVSSLGSSGLAGTSGLACVTNCLGSGRRVATGVTIGGTFTANQFAGGYLGSSDGAFYRIESHPAGVSTDVIDFELSGSIAAEHVSAAATTIDLFVSPFKNVGAVEISVNYYPAGVASVDGAASEFLWVQTWGPCHVLGNAIVSARNAFKQDTTAAGGYLARAADVDGAYGRSNLALAAGVFEMAFLTLWP